MPIYLNKNGQQSGPFDDDVVLGQLQSGLLLPRDLGIRQGDASWRTLAELFPGVGEFSTQHRENNVASTPAKSGGGCLKSFLLSLGILALVLGIGAAIGSRFIPSVSCSLADSDHEEIVKLQADLDKATKNADSDEIKLIQFKLKQTLSGAQTSQENCNQDKLRDNVVGVAGGIVGLAGLLMSVVGLFVGRRK